MLQAVSLELFNELPRLRQSAALRGWLTTVTVHKASRWKQRHLRRAEQELSELDEDQLEAPTPVAPEIIEQAEREQMVRDAVTALSPRCRESSGCCSTSTRPCRTRTWRNVSALRQVPLDSSGDAAWRRCSAPSRRRDFDGVSA